MILSAARRRRGWLTRQYIQYTPDIVNGLYRVYSESYLMDDSGTIETIEPSVWHEFDLNYYGVGLEVGDTETRRFYVDIPTRTFT